MSTILPRDTSLKFPRVIVVDASAGAGKTTTLTQRLAQLLKKQARRLVMHWLRVN